MIELILITALFLYGTKVTWQEGMIFEKPKKWLDCLFMYRDKCQTPRAEWIQEIRKPLYGCPTCMASIWGSIIYSFNMCDSWSVVNLVVFDLATCALTWILMWQFPFDD